MKKDHSRYTINKENFIQFLATSSPEEVSEYIKEKGKPAKLIKPMIFFDERKKNDKA